MKDLGAVNTPRNRTAPRCHRPWQEMIIDSDGTVNPCCYWSAYGNYNQPMGNANEQSIAEIWNGEAYTELRKHMAADDLESAGCSNCFAIKQGFELDLIYDKDSDGDNAESPYIENIRILKKEVGAGATTIAAQPTMIAIAPSHHCHLRCLHCSQEPTRNLALEKKDTLDEVLSLQNVLVRLNAVGGEPFVLPVWRKFLRDFDPSNNEYLCFSTCTSATILPEEVFANFEKFKSVNINVSVDGTGAVYEKVRVRGKWNRLVTNIERLRDIVSKNDVSEIGLSMSVMRSNIHDLPNFIKFAADLDVLFSIIPVTTPLTESLSTFSNMPSQIDGWRESFEESRRVISEKWLPRYIKDRPVSKEDEALWRNAVDIVEETIPWHRLNEPHYRVSVKIPQSMNSLLFTRAQLKSQRDDPEKAPLFVHLQIAGGEQAVAPYHAQLMTALEGHFYFDVVVPAGRFEARIGDKWAITDDNWFSLIVPAGRKAGTAYRGEWTSGKWQLVWATARALRTTLRPVQRLRARRRRALAKEHHVGLL